MIQLGYETAKTVFFGTAAINICLFVLLPSGRGSCACSRQLDASRECVCCAALPRQRWCTMVCAI